MANTLRNSSVMPTRQCIARKPAAEAKFVFGREMQLPPGKRQWKGPRRQHKKYAHKKERARYVRPFFHSCSQSYGQIPRVRIALATRSIARMYAPVRISTLCFVA